jgi:hypothetical protein
MTWLCVVFVQSVLVFAGRPSPWDLYVHHGEAGVHNAPRTVRRSSTAGPTNQRPGATCDWELGGEASQGGGAPFLGIMGSRAAAAPRSRPSRPATRPATSGGR